MKGQALDPVQMIASLADLIEARRKDGVALIVGITGIDTAGKSELATALHRVLVDRRMPSSLVHVDDFHRPRAERYAADLPEPRRYYERSIDFDRLEREVLRPLRRDGHLQIKLRLLDLRTDAWTLERAISVDRGGVVLLEGVFLFRPEVRQYLDLKVFLHVDEAVVLRRAQARDLPAQGAEVLRKYREKYLPAQCAYLSLYPPQTHADVLIDNSRWDCPRITIWPGPRGGER
jgi:uridine kinase